MTLTKLMQFLVALIFTYLIAIASSIVTVNALAIAPSQASSLVNVTLDFDSLPSEQGWTYETFGSSSAPENNVFSISNNVLTQNTLSLGQTNHTYILSSIVDETQDFTLSWRSRVIEEEFVRTFQNHLGFGIGVSSSSQRFVLGFGTETIGIGDNQQTLRGSFDNTVFHDYRIEGSFSSGNAQFFIDDVLTANLSLLNGTAYPNGLLLGDGTKTMNATAEITSYNFRQGMMIESTPESSSILGLLGLGMLGIGTVLKRKF